MTNQYAIYLRKSRADLDAEMRGEGDTLERHRKQLYALAASRNLPIGKVYEEVVSGDTIQARPEMQALLSDVENSLWSGVLVMEIERLARGDTIDQGIVAQTFKYSNTLIVTPVKTYDPTSDIDEEYFEFGLFMARREYKTIKRRLQTGRVASVRDGLYCGSRDLYGYKRMKLPNQKGWSLEIVADQADVVRSIYEWYLHGIDGAQCGCTVISNRLNDLKLTTLYGAPWSYDRVLKILKNPTYCGYVWWSRRVKSTHMSDGLRVSTRVRGDHPIIVPGVHDPIVSKETFDAVQSAISSRRKAPIHADRKTANIFAGLVRCSACGRLMVRQVNRTNPAHDMLKCPLSGCPNHAVYISVVEDIALNHLRSWLSDYSSSSAPATRKSASPSAALISKCQSDLDKLHKQRGNLHDLLEQGVYTHTVFFERLSDINSRIESAESTLSSLNKPQPPSPEDAIRALLPRIATALEYYQFAQTAGDKNLLLKSVISHIDYDKRKRRYKNEPPAAHLTLKVHPNV